MIARTVFDKTDLHFTKAVDTYVHQGKVTGTLALQPDKRHRFFAERPRMLDLMLAEKENPLLEEGKNKTSSRERNGEFYLTAQAVDLLVKLKISRHHQRNMFVLKNDEARLAATLKSLELKDGEDAKIIYIAEIHACPFYLRNEKGKIKCFIVDSEAGVFDIPDEILRAVYKVFPDAVVYLSDTTQQKDFYSCATFAVKTMMYFAKHGDDIFGWLEAHAKKEKKFGNLRYKVLPAVRLMPPLLKMCQDILKLPDESLQAVVSQKKKMTLKQYLAEYAIRGNGKLFNASALLKKYKYLAELNDSLSSQSRPQP